jgi:hypothetical protein
MKKKLSQYDIKMLQALLSDEVRLLRVFPYTSHTREIVIGDEESYAPIRMKNDSFLHKRLEAIRSVANRMNLNDNKIVIQVMTNVYHDGDCVFIGFYDGKCTIGYSVLPSAYPPKEFPRHGYAFGPGYKATKYGDLS